MINIMRLNRCIKGKNTSVVCDFIIIKTDLHFMNFDSNKFFLIFHLKVLIVYIYKYLCYDNLKHLSQFYFIKLGINLN